MSTKPSSQKQTTTSKSPEQTQWMGKALDIYGPTLGQGENIFQGQRVAGFTPTQEQALDVKGFLEKFKPYQDIPMFGETGTALSGLLEGSMGAQPYTPEQSRDLFERIYQKPAEKYYQEETLPSIREAYSGPAFFGSGRAKAQMEGAQDLGDWLGAKRGEFDFSIEQTNRAAEEAKANRALGAVGPALQFGQMPTQEARSRLGGQRDVFAFAGAEQAQKQAEINSAIQRFAEENRITSSEDMQILLALLGMDYGAGAGSSRGAGLGYQAISGLAGGFGSGMGYGIGSNLAGPGPG